MWSKLILTSLVTVTANPVISRSNPSSGVQRTDAYDDLGNPKVATTLISDGGVVYNNFQYNFGVSTVGVQPISPPNTAFAGVLETDVSPSSIATSQVCYALQSFYFGCDVKDAEGVVDAAIKCTVTLVGFNGDNRQVGTQDFTFTPARGNPRPPMTKATVTKIPNAKLVTFNITAVVLPSVAGIDPASLAVLAIYDNVTYVQYDSSAECGTGF